MRLLRLEPESESNIDQALMIVPDDYDKAFALDEAAGYLGDCNITNDIELNDETRAQLEGFSAYRVFVG